MDREKESVASLFAIVGFVVGMVLALVVGTRLHIHRGLAWNMWFLGSVSGCGGFAYRLATRVNAKQFNRGVGLLLCSIGKHWWGPNYRRKDFYGQVIPKEDRADIGGLECYRCNFRPDGRKPRVPFPS